MTENLFDEPAGSPEERRQKASTEASSLAYHAVDTVALMLEDPQHITDEPVWAGASSTRRRARPLTELQAAMWLRNHARGHVGSAIRRARRSGVSWQDIGAALDLDGTPYDQATAAFEYVAGTGATALSYECGTCGGRVTDNGPYDPHPLDQETGHTETCERQAAAVAAWRERMGEDA